MTHVTAEQRLLDDPQYAEETAGSGGEQRSPGSGSDVFVQSHHPAVLSAHPLIQLWWNSQLCSLPLTVVHDKTGHTKTAFN